MAAVCLVPPGSVFTRSLREKPGIAGTMGGVIFYSVDCV